MYEHITPSDYKNLESAIIKSAEEFGWTAKFEKSFNIGGDLIYLGENRNYVMTLQIPKKEVIDRFSVCALPPFGNGDYVTAKKYVESVKINLKDFEEDSI